MNAQEIHVYVDASVFVHEFIAQYVRLTYHAWNFIDKIATDEIDRDVLVMPKHEFALRIREGPRQNILVVYSRHFIPAEPYYMKYRRNQKILRSRRG